MKSALVMVTCVLSLLLVSCSKENVLLIGDQPIPPPGQTKLTIRLTDAPDDYEQVNVEILQVGAFIDETWYDFDLLNPGVYNLLDLTNGNTAMLINDQVVPPGNMTQMRLLLGESNSVVLEDGTVCELKTPSGQSSGYKARIDQPLEEGINYRIMIDFDVSKSLVATGNGKFNLKPVVSAFLDSDIGTVQGYVIPVDYRGTARLYNESVEIIALIDDVSGFFMMVAVPEGIYNLELTGDDPSYQYLYPDEIEVVPQGEVNLGFISF